MKAIVVMYNDTPDRVLIGFSAEALKNSRELEQKQQDSRPNARNGKIWVNYREVPILFPVGHSISNCKEAHACTDPQNL